MNKQVTRLQRISGASAVIALAIIIIAPLVTIISNIGMNNKQISERRETAISLKERLETSKRLIQQNSRLHARSLLSFQTNSVVERVKDQCAKAATVFANLSIQKNCDFEQLQMNGELSLHASTLIVTGTPENLIRALDICANFDAVIDQLNFSVQSTPPHEAILTLRFADVSITDHEPQL